MAGNISEGAPSNAAGEPNVERVRGVNLQNYFQIRDPVHAIEDAIENLPADVRPEWCDRLEKAKATFLDTGSALEVVAIAKELGIS